MGIDVIPMHERNAGAPNEIDILLDRLVMIQLPQEVRLGRHELGIVLEEQSSQTACLTYENVGKLNARGKYLAIAFKRWWLRM